MEILSDSWVSPSEKSTKYGVRRSSWVQSQPLSLLAWTGTSNFYFSHVKAPSIIWRTNRVLSKCLLIHVCLQLCAKHYGKGLRSVQRSVRLRLPAGISQYGGEWKLAAQSFIFFFFILKGEWFRRKILLDICHHLSLMRRKQTIMIMTFRLILSSRSSPPLAPSPDFFPLQETLQYQSNVSAASRIPSLTDDISKWI